MSPADWQAYEFRCMHYIADLAAACLPGRTIRVRLDRVGVRVFWQWPVGLGRYEVVASSHACVDSALAEWARWQAAIPPQ